jgi:MFS family permease
VYALALLVGLLVTGSLSDHVGRRPVVSAGFAVLALSMLTFWHADSVTMLIIARIVQGAAAGVLTSSLSAAVVDLEPVTRPGIAATLNSVSPLGGLATGALLSGLLLDHSASATTRVFGGLTTVYVVIAAAVWLLPETSPRHRGLWHSLVPHVSVPAVARAPFLRGAPALFAAWATGGLYLSLGAPLVGQELGGTDHTEQGLVVTVLTGVGAVTCYVVRDLSARAVTLYGTTALASGTTLTLLALATGSFGGFLAATVVAGSGFGATFLGIMRSVTPLAAPHERGGLFAAVFIVVYVAFAVPAVVAGIASPHIGLAQTTYVYGCVVIALSGAAALLRRFGSTD